MYINHRGTMLKMTTLLIPACWPLVPSSNNVLNTTANISCVHFALHSWAVLWVTVVWEKGTVRNLFVRRGLVTKLLPISWLIIAGKSAGRWHCCPAGWSWKSNFFLILFFFTFGHWLCTFLFWNPISSLQRPNYVLIMGNICYCCPTNLIQSLFISCSCPCCGQTLVSPAGASAGSL